MSPYYKQDYEEAEIAVILKKIKSCVKQNHYTIALNANRKENLTFLQEYNMRSAKQKHIIANLKVRDFCHTLYNTKPGYEKERLYVFVPQVRVYGVDGEAQRIDIYMKFNLIETASKMQTVVISFHKRNKPVDYIFR